MTKSQDRADEAAAEARFAATRNLRVGTEDNLQEIDVNADGVPDVYVLTDNAPQGAQLPDVLAGGPFARGEGSTPDPLLSPSARTWRDRINP